MQNYTILAYYNNEIFDYKDYDKTDELYDKFLADINDLAKTYDIVVTICQAGSDNTKDMYFDACVTAKDEETVLTWLKSFKPKYIRSEIEKEGS